MRVRRAGALGLAVMLLAASASAAVPGPDPDPDQALLARLSVDWMAAIEHKDRARLETLLAPDFVLQLPGDGAADRVGRSEWLANAIGMDWSDFRYENIVVRVEGDQATVTSKLHFKVAPNPLVFDSGIVDTWRKRDGHWQVTTRNLGESQLKQRFAFAAGVLAAALALAAWRALSWLGRRLRSRPA